mmetsp:Transcript_6095/g.17058  ORF Transcript_6095/g.17058 Transcript_6095/m.17058 type:complete len:289 (-) Transcript_6095:133-999(-)
MMATLLQIPVTMGPHVLLAKTKFEKTTGWSIFDPVEPLLAFGLVYCLISWCLSWVDVMEFAGYIPSVLLGVALSRIHLLGALKEQLDRFDGENKKFRAANKDLRASVDSINHQNIQLQASNDQLSKSISGLDDVRVALDKFAKDTNTDIGHLMTSLEGSIEEQRNIQKNCENIQARTKRLTGQQEKAMLMNLFFQFQNQDEEKGMSVEEFETFLDMLPSDSSDKLKGTLRDFKSVDKDNDNTISIKEFRNYVLVCANAIVGDESSTPGATASTLGKGLDYQAGLMTMP